MDKPHDILDKINRNDGLTVPEGYFDDFKRRMSSALPERPELKADVSTAKFTPWQRIRTYVYMAAMFGGIWCMLKLFTMITAPGNVSLDSNSIIADALSDEQFVNEYIVTEINQWDYYDQLIEDGFEPEMLNDSIINIDIID